MPTTLIIPSRNIARTYDGVVLGHSYALRYMSGRAIGQIQDHFRRSAPPQMNHPCPTVKWSGVNGETMATTTGRIPTVLGALTGGVAWMLYAQDGTNDIIAGTADPTTLIANTVTAFKTAVAAGQIPNLGCIGWVTPILANANTSLIPVYAAAIRAACAANGMVCVDANAQFLAAGSPGISSDSVHPDTGGTDPTGQWTYGGFLLPYVSYSA